MRGALAGATLHLSIAQFMLGRKPRKFDFARRLRAQELVMLLAHFDAFMADSVRAICKGAPDTLKRSKTLTWEGILQCESWDNLVAHLIEEMAFSFGWNSARQKIEALQKEFGVVVSANEKDLVTLETAEQFRHLLVHNDGRVSREYNKRARKALRIGTPIDISRRFIDEVTSAVSMVASDTFIAVATKFFSADPASLTGIWRRNAMPGKIDRKKKGVTIV